MREALLILEIGAGFNTPGVVRYPLERLAAQHADARFVRINREYAAVPASLADRALGIAGDAGEVVASVAVAFASRSRNRVSGVRVPKRVSTKSGA
jgi:hypothetical protein